MSSQINKAWLTVNGAAEYTSTSKWTVLRWVKEGLPHARISQRGIRIKVDELDKWMDRFVNHDNDIDAQIERARIKTNKKFREMGLRCTIKPKRKVA